ncbi:hypothetical protein ACOSQ2_007820 [Xanthoceras sorbifolium]
MKWNNQNASSSEVNGGLIKFKNRKCVCSRRAAERILDFKRNSFKLNFYCEKGMCKYNSFWHPDGDEYRVSESKDVVDKKVDREVCNSIEIMEQDIKYLISMTETLRKMYQRQGDSIRCIKQYQLVLIFFYDVIISYVICLLLKK